MSGANNGARQLRTSKGATIMPEITQNDLTLLLNSYKDQVEMNTKLLERQNNLVNRLEHATTELIGAINTQTSELTVRMTKDHSSIKNRIYIALVGMVSILLTLIGR